MYKVSRLANIFSTPTEPISTPNVIVETLPVKAKVKTEDVFGTPQKTSGLVAIDSWGASACAGLVDIYTVTNIYSLPFPIVCIPLMHNSL